MSAGESRLTDVQLVELSNLAPVTLCVVNPDDKAPRFAITSRHLVYEIQALRQELAAAREVAIRSLPAAVPVVAVEKAQIVFERCQLSGGYTPDLVRAILDAGIVGSVAVEDVRGLADEWDSKCRCGLCYGCKTAQRLLAATEAK